MMIETKPKLLRSVALPSTCIHRIQLLHSSTSCSPLATPHVRPNPRLCRRLQHHWRANRAWLVLVTLGFLGCLGRLDAAAATSDTKPKRSTDSHLLPRDLYIVLVSIPVIDKILPLKHLAEMLLARGVRVGFALPDHCHPWISDVEGLEWISLGNIRGTGHANALDLKELQRLGVYASYAATLRYYASFQRPMLGVLLKEWNDRRPDLVIVDRYTFAGFDACHRLHVPYVVNAPHLLVDMDAPPAYIPAPFSNFSMHTTSVLERCVNSYYRLRFRLALVHVYKEINAVREEYGLEAIHSKHQMHGHSLVLVNSVFGLDEARPMTPQFRMVGLLQSPKLQLERAEAESNSTGRGRLPAALTAWLNAPEHRKNPLVFISFPNDVPLTTDFVLTIMNALETAHVKLLWKITLKDQAAFDLRLGPRDSIFFLGEGLDDAAVLALVPEVELLITAGDFQSIQAALVAGVPILGLPHSAEQIEGVNAVVRAGAGCLLDGRSFCKDSLRLAVDTMLFDKREDFKTNAEYLGELVKTGGGVERAVNEVLTVVEFGSRHLLPRSNLQPLYKTYLVDVYLVYGAILCGAAIILRTFVSVVLSVFQPLASLGGARALTAKED